MNGKDSFFKVEDQQKYLNDTRGLWFNKNDP